MKEIVDMLDVIKKKKKKLPSKRQCEENWKPCHILGENISERHIPLKDTYSWVDDPAAFSSSAALCHQLSRRFSLCLHLLKKMSRKLNSHTGTHTQSTKKKKKKNQGAGAGRRVRGCPRRREGSAIPGGRTMQAEVGGDRDSGLMAPRILKGAASA